MTKESPVFATNRDQISSPEGLILQAKDPSSLQGIMVTVFDYLGREGGWDEETNDNVVTAISQIIEKGGIVFQDPKKVLERYIESVNCLQPDADVFRTVSTMIEVGELTMHCVPRDEKLREELRGAWERVGSSLKDRAGWECFSERVTTLVDNVGSGRVVIWTDPALSELDKGEEREVAKRRESVLKIVRDEGLSDAEIAKKLNVKVYIVSRDVFILRKSGEIIPNRRKRKNNPCEE